MMASSARISSADVEQLRAALQSLVGHQFQSLSLPVAALAEIEPSQVGTIVGTIMDALLPHQEELKPVGLVKHHGILGEREGYPDFSHAPTGFRLELKGIFVDNPALACKRPPTAREPSARLTQKVTVKNVDPARDALLLIAYQLQTQPDRPESASPTIIDLAVLSMIELVETRDKRLTDAGGRWFGHYETPVVLSKLGRMKVREGGQPDLGSYGRKESEGKDFNEDTNFGKLKRIPYPPLKQFIARCQAIGLGLDPDVQANLDLAEAIGEDTDL